MWIENDGNNNDTIETIIQSYNGNYTIITITTMIAVITKTTMITVKYNKHSNDSNYCMLKSIVTVIIPTIIATVMTAVIVEMVITIRER